MSNKGIFSINQSRITKAPQARQYSFEERADGKTEDEYELVFYAKLDDVARLNTLRYEDQEQWAYKFTSFNDMKVQNRVRKTIANDTIQYTHTVKTIKFNNLQVEALNECSIEGSQDLFDMYKSISETGMSKRRFFLPIIINKTEFVIEIDVFRNGEDSFFEWVKIDIEMDPKNKVLADWVKHLPDYLTDVIDYRNPTPEQKKQVDELYDTVFLTKNEN